MKLRRMDYVHINGEGELVERPCGLLVDWHSYQEVIALLIRFEANSTFRSYANRDDAPALVRDVHDYLVANGFTNDASCACLGADRDDGLHERSCPAFVPDAATEQNNGR